MLWMVSPASLWPPAVLWLMLALAFCSRAAVVPRGQCSRCMQGHMQHRGRQAVRQAVQQSRLDFGATHIILVWKFW